MSSAMPWQPSVCQEVVNRANGRPGGTARRRLGGGLLLIVTLAGCRIPGTEGPVSRALATSRQLSHRGVNALERGDSQSAEKLLSQAVAACPADPEARRQYAEALWQRHEPLKAVEQLDAALRVAADDDALHIRAGQMRLEMGDQKGAQREATDALDLNPKSAEAWMLRGRVAQTSGQMMQAIADFQRVLGLEPNHRAALLALAEAYQQLNRPERTLANLQQLADTYPPGEEPQQVRHLEGRALLALGRAPEAIETLQMALAQGPPTAELLLHLAEAQYAAGQAEAARRGLLQALQLEPTNTACRTMLVQLEASRTLLR